MDAVLGEAFAAKTAKEGVFDLGLLHLVRQAYGAVSPTQGAAPSSGSTYRKYHSFCTSKIASSPGSQVWISQDQEEGEDTSPIDHVHSQVDWKALWRAERSFAYAKFKTNVDKERHALKRLNRAAQHAQRFALSVLAVADATVLSPLNTTSVNCWREDPLALVHVRQCLSALAYAERMATHHAMAKKSFDQAWIHYQACVRVLSWLTASFPLASSPALPAEWTADLEAVGRYCRYNLKGRTATSSTPPPFPSQTIETILQSPPIIEYHDFLGSSIMDPFVIYLAGLESVALHKGIRAGVAKHKGMKCPSLPDAIRVLVQNHEGLTESAAAGLAAKSWKDLAKWFGGHSQLFESLSPSLAQRLELTSLTCSFWRLVCSMARGGAESRPYVRRGRAKLESLAKRLDSPFYSAFAEITASGNDESTKNLGQDWKWAAPLAHAVRHQVIRAETMTNCSALADLYLNAGPSVSASKTSTSDEYNLPIHQRDRYNIPKGPQDMVYQTPFQRIPGKPFFFDLAGDRLQSMSVEAAERLLGFPLAAAPPSERQERESNKNDSSAPPAPILQSIFSSIFGGK